MTWAETYRKAQVELPQADPEWITAMCAECKGKLKCEDCDYADIHSDN